MGSREERERKARDALRSWQGLAKPWMVDGSEGVKVSRAGYSRAERGTASPRASYPCMQLAGSSCRTSGLRMRSGLQSINV